MPNAVGIVGVGQTIHGNRSDVTYPDLIREGVTAVLNDAGLEPKDLDAIVYGSMPSMMEGVAMNHLYFADALRAVGKPFLRTETCGTTGISLALTGYYYVKSGYADVVMVVGSEKMHEGDSQATMTTVVEPFQARPFISGAPGYYSILSQQYISRYNIAEEIVRDAAAKISVDHRKDAMKNPHAHMRKEVTMDEVKNAPVIVYPIRLLDVCPQSDGVCAMIFASEEKAKKMKNPAAWVKGTGFRGSAYWLGDGDRVKDQGAYEAAREAYGHAGIKNPIEELDVAEIYNPFTFIELLHMEAFGFCEWGKAPELTLKGTFARGGKLPCAPSGGVLCTNPIGATAMIRPAEIALQVTGRAGDRQIEGAKTGFAHGLGGANQFNGVMILSSEL
jgi:acetyl-CoA C-acetyltransferase